MLNVGRAIAATAATDRAAEQISACASVDAATRVMLGEFRGLVLFMGQELPTLEPTVSGLTG
jgi:hypothetical protein